MATYFESGVGIAMLNAESADSAQGYFFADSTASASNDMISPKNFKEFVLPYLIEYHTGLIELGVPGINFHLCGEQNANYEFYPQVPLPRLVL